MAQARNSHEILKLKNLQGCLPKGELWINQALSLSAHPLLPKAPGERTRVPEGRRDGKPT